MENLFNKINKFKIIIKIKKKSFITIEFKMSWGIVYVDFFIVLTVQLLEHSSRTAHMREASNAVKRKNKTKMEDNQLKFDMHLV